MKRAAALLCVFFVAAGYEAVIPYFIRMRDVTRIAPDRQNYFVIDADIWKSARPDLADLRLYDGQTQVPYVLRTQTAGSSREESVARILNLGMVAGHTEFDLDLRGIPEYSRVRLDLVAKNFICTARVQGRKGPNDHSASEIGSSTLYDFTTEGLGSNFVLKFSSASFPYVHVVLAPGVRPNQIRGAYVASFSETKAAWISAGNCSPISGPPKQAAFECATLTGMPVERLQFEVGAEAGNFNRTVSVSDETGGVFERCSISRVRLSRAGQNVISENLAFDLYARIGKFRLTIENGDDVPLPVHQVEIFSAERRVYFDPRGRSTLRLYYGDDKLGFPSYDYSNFFQANPDAAVAQLEVSGANAEYTGRPDERPWSERHRIVLWAAMLIAVALLGVVAIRGLAADKNTEGD